MSRTESSFYSLPTSMTASTDHAVPIFKPQSVNHRSKSPAIFWCPGTFGCWLLCANKHGVSQLGDLLQIRTQLPRATHSGKTSSQVTHPVVFTRNVFMSPAWCLNGMGFGPRKRTVGHLLAVRSCPSAVNGEEDSPLAYDALILTVVVITDSSVSTRPAPL